MKLEKILDQLNSLEKYFFLKIIGDIISDTPGNIKAIEKILTDPDIDLKNVDNINIVKVFNLIQDEFTEHVIKEFAYTSSQLDLLTDIIMRDGNCIMKQDWFARLYENELKYIGKKVIAFKNLLKSEQSEMEEQRKRDYNIYKACLYTAYFNDVDHNQETKITHDEQSILLTLSNSLGLSQEEIKLIYYSIIPIQKLDIETIINNLKNLGIIFYSKKNNLVYVAEEVVWVLRKVRRKEVADKFLRRVLRLLKEPQINLICRKHNIDWKMPLKDKLMGIINEGLSFSDILVHDIHKENAKISDKKILLNQLFEKGLKIKPSLKGVTIEDKIQNLIKYFNEIEKDEKVGISIDGYEDLLIQLNEVLPKLNTLVKDEFELQEEVVLKSNYLLNFNIKPRDILEILSEKDLLVFCQKKGIKTRGDLVLNIMEGFKDSENIYLENYENFGFRDLNALKENGIRVTEAELGIKFEDLTKTIFTKLGFNVDEKLRKSLNTKKDKIDVLINLGNNDVILIECKTVKESGYNKFSSVSRQLKAYSDLAKKNELKVLKSLLIAPEFSDEFVNDCELEYDLNLSLIKAASLIKILEGFKNSKHKTFPYKLLLRDVLIQEDRILKAIGK